MTEDKSGAKSPNAALRNKADDDTAVPPSRFVQAHLPASGAAQTVQLQGWVPATLTLDLSRLTFEDVPDRSHEVSTETYGARGGEQPVHKNDTPRPRSQFSSTPLTSNRSRTSTPVRSRTDPELDELRKLTQPPPGFHAIISEKRVDRMSKAARWEDVKDDDNADNDAEGNSDLEPASPPPTQPRLGTAIEDSANTRQRLVDQFGFESDPEDDVYSKKVWFAVTRALEHTGVYSRWSRVKAITDGVSGNTHQGAKCKSDALKLYLAAVDWNEVERLGS